MQAACFQNTYEPHCTLSHSLQVPTIGFYPHDSKTMFLDTLGLFCHLWYYNMGLDTPALPSNIEYLQDYLSPRIQV